MSHIYQENVTAWLVKNSENDQVYSHPVKIICRMLGARLRRRERRRRKSLEIEKEKEE